MPPARAVAELYARETVKAFRSDGLVYVTLVTYLVVGAAFVLLHNRMLMGAIDIYARACTITYCMILPFIVLMLGIAKITHRLDRHRALAYRAMFSPRRVARFIAGTALMTLVLVPFESMFASVKSALSDGAFPYDKLAADVDKALHFGHAPAKYLLAIASNEWVLRAVEFNYDVLWFIVCFAILYWVAISPRADGIRLRYCASFFFVWVLVGNVAAALFPTAGPAFYGLVTNDPQRFEQLREFLDSSAGWFSSAADEQHYLWSLHAAGVSGFGSGISAFPSMHVALISLNALFAAERSRRLGILAWVYVGVILLSSVYLGWHYAIDGYVAILLAIAIYWAVRRAMPFIRRLADGPLLPGMRPLRPGMDAAAG